MPKYRKKPVVIEAEQFNRSVLEWPEGVVWNAALGEPVIETLEGKLMVSDGDWIITGVANEKYPCKDSIFKATYEPVEE